MIVVDASAMTELLLQTPVGFHVEARLFRDGDEFHAPHLLDVEVVQALRCLVRAGEVLPGRAWELRDNLTAYDAMYVALAEALDAPLVTCDGPLGAAPGVAARVEVIR